MSLPTLIYYIIIGVLYIGTFVLLSKLFYFICLFNFIRIITGTLFILFSLFFLVTGEWQLSGILLGLSLEFLRKFYLYTNTYKFKENKNHISNVVGIILKPIALFLHLGTKAGQYAVSVVDGTVSAKKELKREKAEFENEKQAFKAKEAELEDKYEEILKAWEELIREREEFERQKAGESNNEKKGYSQNRSYQDFKQKSKSKSEKQNKQKTGKYYPEWEKFNFDNLTANNPYDVLGVPQGADKTNIKKAYKKLAMKFHPDRHNNEPSDKMKEAEAIFKLIGNAYDRVK